ncbi:MAG: DUF2752 domain-containing protein [Verrucomicrobiales bacterium]
MLPSGQVTGSKAPPPLKGGANHGKGAQWKPARILPFMPFFVAGVAAVAYLFLRYKLPVPPCYFKTTSGVPCPFCGSTRAMAQLATLNIIQAFAFNPLLTLAAAGSFLLCFKSVREWMLYHQAALGWILGGLVFLNWIYLVIFLP